ncbi:multiple C2 and transmembrane domain-containing protein isoform X3 [Linepithema humile]|uniref:multiple C2 and transmembrane domain-containing protein isoform X3 n=1 Tax=Linepithema humile TaxID=83485 RepID=UPI000623952A|nr:PREDICTED: multiple C2 and transmembrane domain-containing protein 1 isoform X3 [Linepithema humile]
MFKMNNAAEKDLSLELASKLNVKPEVEAEIDLTSEIAIASEADAARENSVADAFKADVTSEQHTVSNTDVVSNKIDGTSIDKSSDIKALPRRLHRKPCVDRRGDRPVATSITNRTVSKLKLEKDIAEMESDSDENIDSALDGSSFDNISEENSSSAVNEKSTNQLASAIEQSANATEEPFARTISETQQEGSSPSAVESEKLKVDPVAPEMMSVWKAQVAEGSSAEDKYRAKKRKAKNFLRSSLERKVEKVLENHVERIWEESLEKHPWLQPIDTWIADRKSSSSYTLAHRQQDVEQDIVATKEPTYDFKYTSATGEDEEPTIESGAMENRGAGLDESKIESRVIENLRRLRDRAGSSKSNRFEPANLIAQPKKQDAVTSRADDGMENSNVLIDPSNVLEVKEVKRHDLLDKLKDNVKEKMEDICRYFQKTNRLADVNRRLKSQIWSSVVTIVLVEAKNLLPMDIDGLSDPYVKFRLGTEKYKSKVVNKTLNPVWLEQFDLHLYEDPCLGQELEVTVWDRDRSHQDDIMGRTLIDLATLERETTHRLWRELEDGSGSIFLLLTISGTTASETISDLAAHEETPMERAQLIQRYSIGNTLQRVRDVGHLTVKVYRAQGLAAADLGGKSDPFCVLELVNSRLQTQTEYKTLAPNWQKIFTFNVKDINAVLEVTVYDEDRDHKVEFLGKVAIPLLKIRNGEKRWYALKDKKLRGRAKGNCAQILLELTVVWNIFRACVRTLNPKEKKYMEPEVKFKRQVFLRNVMRLKAIIVIFIDIGKYIQSCWEWENKMRSILALVFFILGCYYFEPYMIPGVALLILLKYYLVAVVTGAPLIYASSQFQDHSEIGSDDCPPTPGDDDDDEDDKDKEEKKSLKERLQAIQEVTQTVQNSIGYIASLCERVKNLFNFTIPYLSYLAMLLAIGGAVVLYFIPIRYLILAWGVNKFSRKIFRPHSVPNNEVLDLISRVPDDEELLNYRELKPVPTADCEKGGTSGSPGSNAARREQRKRHKAA